MTINEAFQIAMQHHQSGRLAEAEALYRQILAVEPGDAGALHYLGVIAHQVGRNDAAIALIRQAIALAPHVPDFHSNLGVALAEKGCLGEAIAAYRQAIALKPGYPEAQTNLGNALKGKGCLDEAIAAYRHAIVLKPDYALAHNNLGGALCEKGCFEEAIAACRQAIALDPGQAEAQSNLGVALFERGHLDEAIAAHRRAIALKPDYAEPHSNLGNALRARGQPDEAIAAYYQAIALKPGYAEAHSNLGAALRDNGCLDEAFAAYRQAIALKPDYCEAHSNLVYSLHFHPGQNPGMLAAEHERWNRQFAEPLRGSIRGHGNDRSPGRRLRIGYLSPDFRQHVICHFLLPLLEGHGHGEFEIWCYASVKREDWITQRMRKSADVWRDVLALDDEALAGRIREDGIDILVDLTQHMADNRLRVFARKPAPVQMAWVGYPGSTGLETMDYRLTDWQMEPEGASWAESVEEAVRLPDSWFSFEPLHEYPAVSELPALRAGHVTFGCLNNFCKVNEGVLSRWSKVLRAVEGSRLLLQCPAGRTQERVREYFRGQGIGPERVELVSPRVPRGEFLGMFGRMDLVLDPFPYNGGTTTCEALWMGIPVLTLPGEVTVSRIGLSILKASGMGEFVANSEEEYVELARSLARDLPRLAGLRATLRERMKASAFMNGAKFARDVESAYREMWRKWCARASEKGTP